MEDEERRILRITQHVLLDAAGLVTAGGYVATKQLFEGISPLRPGVRVDEKGVHGDSAEGGMPHLNAESTQDFMTFSQQSIERHGVFHARRPR